MDWIEIILVFASLILCGLGIVGSVAPALPGPPFAYAAILIYHFGRGDVFSTTFLIVAFFIVLIVVGIDYFLPVYATKKFGGSKQGVWGGIIGLIAGLFFAPWGIIVGPLVGAIIGDLIGGKQFEHALKSGIGSFIGFLAATFAKLTITITLTVFLIIKIVQVNFFI